MSSVKYCRKKIFYSIFYQKLVERLSRQEMKRAIWCDKTVLVILVCILRTVINVTWCFRVKLLSGKMLTILRVLKVKIIFFSD